MNSTLYDVYLNNYTIANGLELQYAVILIKGLFEEFYNDHDMTVSIKEHKRELENNE